MDKPTVSIAMCTYNGATFLEEQLASFVAQTQLPNELVVCDDASTDTTVEILENFAKNAPFQVKIMVNKQSLGVTKNFEKATSQCTGDIVFLCDQDDIWFPEKIKKTINFFTQNNDCQLVISDAELIDANGNKLEKGLLEVLRMRNPQQKLWHLGRATETFLGGNRVAGCVAAVRKEFVQKCMPFPTHIPTMIHDGWLGVLAALEEKIGVINEPLVQYRQHATQQIGADSQVAPKAVGLRERFSRPRAEKLAPIQKEIDYLKTFREAAQKVVPDAKGWPIFEQKLRFLESRTQLSESKTLRVFPVLNHLLRGNYHKFADQDAAWTGGFLAAIGDVVE